MSIKKEIKNRENITYKIKFIDRARFMQKSLSNLVVNLPHKNELKDCECCLNYEAIKDKALQLNCLPLNNFLYFRKELSSSKK